MMLYIKLPVSILKNPTIFCRDMCRFDSYKGLYIIYSKAFTVKKIEIMEIEFARKNLN
jgi:hypothetical protein